MSFSELILFLYSALAPNVRGYPKFSRSRQAQAEFVPNRRGARLYPPAPACSARSEQSERRGDRTEEVRRADEADEPLLGAVSINKFIF